MNADSLLNAEPAAFATDKLIDRLFTKTSLRCITASSIRERERLIHLFKGIDRAIHSTGVEYEYYKKVLNRRHNILEKNKNRPRHDVSHKPATTAVPARRPGYAARCYISESVPGVNLPTVPLSPTSAKTTTHKLFSKLALLRKPRSLSVASDSDSVFTDQEDNQEPARHVLRVPEPRGGTHASTRPSMNPEQIKKLVLKLHRPDGDIPDPSALSEEEQKVYELLQQTASPSGLEATPSRQNSTRMWTDDTHNRQPIALGETIEEDRSETRSSERYMRRVRSQPSTLPPIYRQATRPLTVRQWELDKPTNTEQSAPSMDEWEDLKYCRYLRAPGGLLNELDADQEEQAE